MGVITEKSLNKGVMKEKFSVRSFVKNVGYTKLFLTFMFACFLGTTVETMWCFVTRGYLESRKGLIYGPFNLVYGLGALIMLLFLSRFEKSWAIFLGSAVIGGAFEYFCSVFQEMSFGTVSWYYGGSPASIGGRINALYMIFWGGLGLLFIRVLFPMFSTMLDTLLSHFSDETIRLVVILLTVFMVCNAAISFAAVWRQAKRREGFPPSNRIEIFLDKTYTDQRLERIFPNMQLVTDQGAKSLWGNENYNYTNYKMDKK